ncbi:hypothetical protein HBI24_007700 [Parastagonospora nodorum]|nr:hypothetical protein HBH52_247990 [Parastagonospora nodorum]KAH4039489.1 hypothetical protein HBI09_032710 [Parastagonospora nodorum]KAH4113712.1 hypothetical protein HBH47_207130 [Parastagonospora nodorum]KAH4201463.1 hypothetical protein HBH42_029750 [Parastagonospora nodorum]KAH4234300.1 hypothetical protein HBI05_156340 [Parastagonospora nodorum]
MPTVKSLGAALNTFSVNKTSNQPTVSDPAHMDTELFKEVDSSGPTLAFTPFTTNVTVKHSSAFNSERDSGMSKFQQIQFVEALKKMIIGSFLLSVVLCVCANEGILDEAALTYPGSKDLIVSISRKNKAGHMFCSAAVHTATLLARQIGSQTWIVLGRGDECEYFPDAVESLWEMVLVAAGKVAEGCQVGNKIPRRSSVDQDSSIGVAVASER